MSWEQLAAIAAQNGATAATEAAVPPVSCPNDGTPLETGHDGGLFCRFDGWRPDGRHVDDPY